MATVNPTPIFNPSASAGGLPPNTILAKDIRNEAPNVGTRSKSPNELGGFNFLPSITKTFVDNCTAPLFGIDLASRQNNMRDSRYWTEEQVRIAAGRGSASHVGMASVSDDGKTIGFERNGFFYTEQIQKNELSAISVDANGNVATRATDRAVKNKTYVIEDTAISYFADGTAKAIPLKDYLLSRGVAANKVDAEIAKLKPTMDTADTKTDAKKLLAAIDDYKASQAQQG